uniref:ARAD1B06512p n=1 Tax=Blastobotrys adeninivorans TaxID=409370 RepID=A0A060T5U8_BLAAD
MRYRVGPVQLSPTTTQTDAITSGGMVSYTRVPLISGDEIEKHNDAAITAVAAYDQSLYLGTSSGEVLHFFRADDSYIISSKQKTHSKKTRSVSRILLLPSVSRGLVLCNQTTAVFSLPEFTPLSNMGSLRDVNDICIDSDNSTVASAESGVEVTVFAKSLIRVVNVFPESLKLVRNIDYPGVVTGVRRSLYGLVANTESYDLIDLQNIRKIPLFPISQAAGQEDDQEKLTPLVCPVGSEEFLVTSGVKSTEPSMGMVVNVDGDISRGTIAWEAYPSSIAVDFPNVAAVIGNKVVIHSLLDQGLVDEISYETTPIVVNVLASHKVPHKPLAEKVQLVPIASGEEDVDTAELPESMKEKFENESELASKMSILSSSLFVYSESNGVECLLSSPRVLALEQMVIDGQANQVLDELESNYLSSELAFVSFEYLHLLIGINVIKGNDFGDMCRRAWIEEGQSLDPRILVYVFSPQDVHGDLWVFNGVVSMIRDLKKRKWKKNTKAMEFFRLFVKAWLGRRGLESIGADKINVIKSLEMAHLRLILSSKLSHEQVEKEIQENIIETIDEAEHLLMTHKRFFLLSQIKLRKGLLREAFEYFKNMLTDPEWHDDDFENGPEQMAAILATVEGDDSELVWEYGLWLATHFPDAGIKVFMQDRGFDEEKVLQAFKDSGVEKLYLQYLKYLVYDRKTTLFTSDLITFVANGVVEKLEAKANSHFLHTVNETYRGLSLPKRIYYDYFKSQTKKKGITEDESSFVELRTELLTLLQRTVDFDVQLLLKQFEADKVKNLLTMERAIIYGRLGVHERSLQLLTHSVGDFATAMRYCRAGHIRGLVIGESGDPEVGSDDATRADLFRILFLEFLKLSNEDWRVYCTQHLLDQWGTLLDVNLVLSNIPNDWKVRSLDGYLTKVFRALANQKNKSIVQKSLSRSANSYYSSQYDSLKEYAEQQQAMAQDQSQAPDSHLSGPQNQNPGDAEAPGQGPDEEEP